MQRLGKPYVYDTEKCLSDSLQKSQDKRYNDNFTDSSDDIISGKDGQIDYLQFLANSTDKIDRRLIKIPFRASQKVSRTNGHLKVDDSLKIKANTDYH